MPEEEELDVQIAAEALSNLWQGGSSPRNARTMAVAATATSMARSSSQLFSRVSQHPLVTIPVKMYRNSRRYSRNSADKLRRMIARRRLMSVQPSAGDIEKKPQVGTEMKRRWKRLMLSAGLASLSRESRQRIRYCLHLLNLAAKSLVLKVNQLNEVVQEERAFLRTHRLATRIPKRKYKRSVKDTIASLKKDIVFTIYKSVAVISNVAGSTLPEPARTHVRAYIMRMPSRWAQSVQGQPSVEMDLSSSGGDSPSTWTTPEPEPHPELHAQPETSIIDEADLSGESEVPVVEDELQKRRLDLEVGDRVLTLAQESLDMLEHIIQVFGDTLEKAEMWVDKWKFKKKSSPQKENADKHSTDSESEYNTADEIDESNISESYYEDMEDEDVDILIGDEDLEVDVEEDFLAAQGSIQQNLNSVNVNQQEELAA